MMTWCISLSSYITFSRRNGTAYNDINAIWWDELPVDGAVTSFVKLVVLSKSTGPAIRVVELEQYTGYGGNLNDKITRHENIEI